MITYKWTISSIDCKVSENELSNIASTVHWRYTGTDQHGVTAEMYGAQSVGAPNPEEFTDFSELTSEMVTAWLVESLDVKSMQEGIAAQIDQKINPTHVNLQLTEPIQEVPFPIEDEPVE